VKITNLSLNFAQRRTFGVPVSRITYVNHDVGLSCIHWRASYHQVRPLKTLPEEAAALGCMDYQAKVKAYDTVVKCVVILVK